MPTTDKQRDIFIALKRDINNNMLWREFMKEWKGYMMAIISRKLFFAVSIWEDALNLSYAKIFRFIEKFEENREPSPWINKVVASACEDVKLENGYGMKDVKILVVPVSENDGQDADFEEWVGSILNIEEETDAELFEDVWCCVVGAMNELGINEMKKTAFLLYYRHNHKLREIAEILRMEQSTVYNWPSSVLKQILPTVRANLREWGYETPNERKMKGNRRRI